MSVNTMSALERSGYNDEFRVDFEREETMLKKCTRSDGLMRAGTIYWDVVSPSEEAQVRSRDGDIPESQLTTSQVSDTPVKRYVKYRMDSFDEFKNNPNYRKMQYRKCSAGCHRSIDQKIIDTLDTATNELNSGSAVAFSTLATFLQWTSSLWSNDVPNDGRVWGILTPNAHAQMLRINEFKSSDYVTVRPMENGIPAMGYRRWLDVNWVTHTGLSGTGTATADCMLFHESAIGHQIAGDPEIHAYYYEPQDRYEVWGGISDAAALALPRGVYRAVHDDTAAFS